MKRSVYGVMIVAALSSGHAVAADFEDKPQQTMVYDIDHGVKGRSLPSNVSGYVQGNYAHQIDNGDAQTWNLRGAANVHVGQGFNIQADAGYAKARASGLTEDGNQFAGQLHGYYRNEQGYAVGAFFQAGQSEWGRSEATAYTWGLEAAYFVDSATVYARAGLGNVEVGRTDFDQVAGAIGARIYANDNLRFDIEAAKQNLSQSWIDIDRIALTFTGNYRLEQLPVTLFAGYQYQEEELSFGRFSRKGDGSILFAGARYSFGSQSLKDEERTGVLWQ